MDSRICRRSAGSSTAGRIALKMANGRGVYVLTLNLSKNQPIQVGRLGKFKFPAGFYLYVGSAMGPGGLKGRLARHCRPGKKLHWHVDYLRQYAPVQDIWALETGERLECRWAAAAGNLPGVTVPAPRFGASDCRCPSHLYHFDQQPELSAFAAAAGLPMDLLKRVWFDGPGF